MEKSQSGDTEWMWAERHLSEQIYGCDNIQYEVSARVGSKAFSLALL